MKRPQTHHVFKVDNPQLRPESITEKRYISRVIQAVCAVCNLTESELLGSSRKRERAIAKCVLSGILFDRGYGLPAQTYILPRMNECKIDHTTIRRRVENHRDWLELYQSYREQVERVYIEMGK